MSLRIERPGDAEAVAQYAAREIAAAARAAVAARGRFAFAASGGRSPGAMLRALASEAVPWERTHVFQVDERDAPVDHAERNWTGLRRELLDRVPIGDRAHAMAVEAGDPDAAARAYQRELETVCGTPAALDLVHLGLGPDGHTASLVPGDPVLDVVAADVAWSAPYQGRPRMTLTFPALARARRLLWVVTGEDKRDALARLVRGDRSIPAGRVARTDALLVTDLGDLEA